MLIHPLNRSRGVCSSHPFHCNLQLICVELLEVVNKSVVLPHLEPIA